MNISLFLYLVLKQVLHFNQVYDALTVGWPCHGVILWIWTHNISNMYIHHTHTHTHTHARTHTHTTLLTHATQSTPTKHTVHFQNVSIWQFTPTTFVEIEPNFVQCYGTDFKWIYSLYMLVSLKATWKICVCLLSVMTVQYNYSRDYKFFHSFTIIIIIFSWNL